MLGLSEGILSRISNPLLEAPAPKKQEVMGFISCAFRAPDHGCLKPWRFIVLEGDALVSLGDCFAATEPEAEDSRKDKLRNMPLRAPMIVVTVARLQPDHNRVPVWEQQVAAGIATQHIQLAAHELGYGSIWRTGDLADHPTVKNHLNVQSNEQIVAFLYLGSPSSDPKPKPLQFPEEAVEFRI